MKIKKLYIHVGMPKTGSSAIQAFLALNFEFLAKNNMVYPWHPGFGQAFQTSSGNAHQLHDLIINSNYDHFSNLMNDVKYEKVILSSEFLFHTIRLAPEKFAKFFEAYDIHVICYIRRIDDFLESCINQLIKNHGMIDYSNFDSIIDDHDYATTLIKLEKYIPIEKIIIRIYDVSNFTGGTIYSDFSSCLNLDINDDILVYPDKQVNPSLNRNAFEFRRILNSLAELNSNEYWQNTP
jgi:hypothetical protein